MIVKMIILLFLLSIKANDNFLYDTQTHLDYIKCTKTGNNNCLPVIDGKLGKGVCCKNIKTISNKN